MSLNINFKQAIQDAAFSIVLESLSSPELASLTNIGALALGILAIYGVEAASQMKQGFDLTRNANHYRVALLPDFDPQKNEEAISHAVDYLKQNHKKAFKWYCKDHNLSSDHEAILFFQNYLSGGTCHGQVMHLLEKAKETNSSFNRKIVNELKMQAVCLKQMVHHLHSGVCAKIKNIDVIEEVKSNKLYHEQLSDVIYKLKSNNLSAEQLEKEELLLDTKHDLKQWKEDKLIEFKKAKKELKSADFSYSASIIKSKQFPATAQESSYQAFLEEALNTVSSENGVVGSINIPSHILAFQYSSEGYFLYDSINSETGGLLKYPNKETFFQQMKEQILRDTQETDNPNKDAFVRFEIIPLSG